MNATKHSQAIFSNSLNHLLAKLAKDLFSTHQQPFTKRWILVANTETGHWLRRELIRATSNRTFMGSMIFSSSDSLVKHLFTEVCQEKTLTPDYITLPLFIHEALNNIFLTHPIDNQLFSTQPHYAFTKKLGNIFKKFYTFSQIPSRKNRYYKNIISQLISHFPSIQEVFSSIIKALQSMESPNYSLHIFGCSNLPQSVVSFFTKLNHFFPVYFYCFSPTQEYFGDLLSDKAIDFLWNRLNNYSNRHAWEQYVLSDRQALLANLSHKSKTIHNFLLDNEIDYCEEFIPPQETTTLGKVQSTIFHLRPSTPLNPEDQDSTLTISTAIHPSREVQEVFSKISLLIHQGVSPREIFILSSQLSTYEVYLKATFSPHLPIYFTHSESSHAKELKEKFLLLSSLLQTQGNLHCLLQILTHPRLQHAVDSQHIPYLWKKISEEWNKTFKKRGKVVQKLGDTFLNDYLFFEESGKINPIELWEKLLPFLYDLQQFIDFYSEDFHRTYEEHVNTIFSFLEATFLLSSHELSYITSLKNALSSFSHLKCTLVFFCDFCLDFLSYCCSGSPLYNQPGPYVGSLEDLSLLPKGHTFILGANKSSSIDFLDLVDSIPGQEELIFSSSEDEENLHFLQILISTKYALHISYLSSPNMPSLPSAYVGYLQDTLCLPIHHLPSKAYFPSLFKEKKLLHTSQEHYYKLAQSFSSIKTPLASLFPSSPVSQKLPEHLDIAEIVQALISPLDFFLKSNYQISLRPPHVLKTHDKLFPTKSDIFAIWENYLTSTDNQLTQNYLSEFSKKIFISHEDFINQWLIKIHSDSLKSPYSVIFSSSLFHDLHDRDILLPPLSLSWNNSKIHLHGKLSGVFSYGIYLCSLDPSPLSKTKRKIHSVIPETTLDLQNYLQAQISLAMLQYSGILNSQAAIYRVHSLDAQEIIPAAFSDPQEYLNRILCVYHLMQEYPIPLVSPECWQALTDGEALHKTIHKVIAADIHNPSLSIFWKFHNRASSNFIISEEQRLLILSLFQEVYATF
ncbi:exodeoxyribonuclease V subunit gamma [Chlamydia avium]|uniref:Exodeoxyribonuclease V, gamma subunit n=1 Tax=Chlamydia avium TaxID=1457141 RepID=A0ABP2X7W9_9CHLA|nr:exodeoxyribonuclease V subunit gamma [Chlamydia avium]EPP36233.1 exodeoxyribonuclease V, gamma subunit [Chlamydia psittaci 10_743_SC13]EPP38939.1 exodeoxyribonuclease V, gamma subunit [Chlamydia avium]